MDKDREKFLAKTALEVRKDVVRTIGVANANHLASSLSVVEILVYLYWEVMRVDPQRPNWEGRDRLVFSKGHACPALYAVLARLGFLAEKNFGVTGGLVLCCKGILSIAGLRE